MVDSEWDQRLDRLDRHLRTVRQRLLSVFVVLGFGGALTFWHRGTVMAVLFAPAAGMLSPTGQPIFTAPTEIFEFTVRLAVIGGVVAATPVAVFHVARLAWPGLPRQVRRFVGLFLPAALLCYLTGAAFAYWVLLPAGFRFLLSFGAGAAVAYIRVADYFALALSLVLWLGVIFELPLAMFMAVKLEMVRYERLKRLRKYVVATMAILAPVIAPTADIVNALLVFVPMVALYELGLILAWLAQPRMGVGWWVARYGGGVLDLVAVAGTAAWWVLARG